VPHIGFHAVPGVGELFVIPALTFGGPCDILFWEAVPAGPADLWAGAPMEPERQLPLMLDLAAKYVPWVADRTAAVELTDAQAACCSHRRRTCGASWVPPRPRRRWRPASRTASAIRQTSMPGS
jgi:hypothetical protein